MTSIASLSKKVKIDEEIASYARFKLTPEGQAAQRASQESHATLRRLIQDNPGFAKRFQASYLNGESPSRGGPEDQMIRVNSSLQDALHLPSCTLAKLADMLLHAEAHVSFCGSAFITTPAYPGSVDLEEIARRVLDLVSGDRLQLMDRMSGVKLLKKLRQYYTLTDDLLWSTSPITIITALFKKAVSFLSACFWNICDPLYTTRWLITEESSMERLLQLTREQFQSFFPDQTIPPSKQYDYEGVVFRVVSG